jgi:hypothetical protein
MKRDHKHKHELQHRMQEWTAEIMNSEHRVVHVWDRAKLQPRI